MEIWFYLAFALSLSMKLGLTFESFSLNFGVVTVNNAKVPRVELVTQLIAVALGFACCISNWKVLKKEYEKRSQSHSKLIDYVNSMLQETTGNIRDRVSRATILGWLQPKVNTGAWLSYRLAREALVVEIPLELLIEVKLKSSFSALIRTMFSWLFPFLTTITLIIICCQNAM